MSEQQGAGHEAITEVVFGQVVLVPYPDGDRSSVVMRLLGPEFAETAHIISDVEKEEMLAMPGGSQLAIMQVSDKPNWGIDKIVRGLSARYQISPDDAVGSARVRTIVEGYAATF